MTSWDAVRTVGPLSPLRPLARSLCPTPTLVVLNHCCGWQMNFLLTLAALHCSALQSAPAQAYTAAWCAERSRTGLHGRLVCVFGNSISRPLQRTGEKPQPPKRARMNSY
ncbi:unnamed protein product [Prorocentrum cordatum]|uniref:Tafazzin family protein n=1 Tax=Prorocentrum cordatum TaxID=2364126 RepID=A0ABN9RHU2_9DINO|nr:unnamed protein product [Polarella glacialis]